MQQVINYRARELGFPSGFSRVSLARSLCWENVYKLFLARATHSEKWGKLAKVAPSSGFSS